MYLVSRRRAGRERFAAAVLPSPLEWVSCAGSADRCCSTPQEERSMFAPSVNPLPDAESELFEQVTNDELAKYY
jgi:hypothetical protein